MTWQPLEDGLSPYVHWFASKNSVLVGSPPDSTAEEFLQRFFDHRNISFSKLADAIATASDTQEPKANTSSTQGGIESFNQHLRGHFGKKGLPFFAESVGSCHSTIDIGSPALPSDEQMTELAKTISKDAILTAVIDIGISPVHHRFRQTKDTTRVLSSWQQAGEFDAIKERTPFGSELLKGDIDAALRDPTFDEAQYFKETGLVRPDRPYGARDLDFRFSHGTHMADLACGDEPAEENGSINRPILAVNMPSKYAIGSAGTYLSVFALAALIRVVAFGDKLWEKMNSERKSKSKWSDVGGFPLVVNFSFGMQAGPKDGNGWLETPMQKIIEDRKAPLDICVPAGNDNLNRASARAELNFEDTSHTFFWRVPPADRSSNFVEIWTRPLGDKRPDIEFKVKDPNGNETKWLQFANGNGDQAATQFYEFDPSVTLYQRRWPSPRNDKGETFQYQVVIAMLPTDIEGSLSGDPIEAAQSGLWEIEVRATDPTLVTEDEHKVDVFFHIQSDQDIRPGRDQTSLRSYFDSKEYNTHTVPDDPLDGVPIGMPRDSYHLALEDPGKSWQLDDWRFEGPIQRKGSQNALATNSALFIAGAYRLNDERPSAYSSTAQSERAKKDPAAPKEPEKNGPSGITALLPGDDSPMHPGLLGAGSTSGSVVTLQGTSGAAALATREMVETWATLKRTELTSKTTGRKTLLKVADGKRTADQKNRAANSRLKSGAGVIPSSHYTALRRHGPGW